MLEILRVVLSDCDADQHWIVGGAERLPRGLWHLGADCRHWPGGTSLASLHAGVPRPGVAGIARVDRTRIRVTDVYGNAEDFPSVLATCQSWLLTTAIDTDETLFSQSHWMSLDRTSYMQSAKTFVMVDRPFWRDPDPLTGEPCLSMTLTDRLTRGTYPDLPRRGPARGHLPELHLDERCDEDAAAAGRTPASSSRSRRSGGSIPISTSAATSSASRSRSPGRTIRTSSVPSRAPCPATTATTAACSPTSCKKDFAPDERGIFIAGDDVSWTPGWAEGAVQTALNAVWGHRRSPRRADPDGQSRAGRSFRRAPADRPRRLTQAEGRGAGACSRSRSRRH